MEFLQALFSEIPETAAVCLFTIPGRAARRFRAGQLAAAAAWAAAQAKENVYIEVAWGHGTYGDRRIQASDTQGIVGLWADVDVAGDGHAGGKIYAPSKDAALDVLLTDCPLPPSMVVDSGNGLQAWWLFNEPWSFDTPNERGDAADLAQRWTATVRSYAQRHGWTTDSTGDLARLMRLPGTRNVKNADAPLDVVVIPGIEMRRYNPADFDPYLVDGAPISAAAQTATVNAEKLTFSGDAEPPSRKFQALLSNDSKFDASWNRRRKDLGDQSPSAYDLSLAAIAVQAGWTNQEIVDLLIYNRAEHGDDLKVSPDGRIRADYYIRTLAKLRAESGLPDAVEQVEDAKESGVIDEIESARAALLANLSAHFDVGIRGVIKYLASPVQYRLDTEKGDMLIGGAADLLSQTKVHQVLIDVAGKCPRTKFKDYEWRRIVQAMLDVADVVAPSEELTEDGAVKNWLEDYMSANPPSENHENAIAQRRPFLHLGEFAFFLDHLRGWLYLKRNEDISTQKLGVRLHQAGYRSKTVTTYLGGRKSSRAVWVQESRVVSMEQAQ